MSDELWQAYWSDPTDENRNALVLANIGLVEQQAHDWFHRRNQHSFYLGDFITWGCLGLIKAIEHYKPRRGVRFSTYAFIAIRCGILNGLNQAVANTQRTNAKKEFAKRFVPLGSYEKTEADHVPEIIQREYNRHVVQVLIREHIADWQRRAFELHYLEGVEAKEIAKQMNLKLTRVHQMLCMGRQRIKSALNQP